MDLSFNRFDRDTELTVLPPDLAVLMVGATARQAPQPDRRNPGRIHARVPRSQPVFPPRRGVQRAYGTGSRTLE